jgi:hypothetical protein
MHRTFLKMILLMIILNLLGDRKQFYIHINGSTSYHIMCHHNQHFLHSACVQKSNSIVLFIEAYNSIHFIPFSTHVFASKFTIWTNENFIKRCVGARCHVSTSESIFSASFVRVQKENLSHLPGNSSQFYSNKRKRMRDYVAIIIIMWDNLCGTKSTWKTRKVLYIIKYL